MPSNVPSGCSLRSPPIDLSSDSLPQDARPRFAATVTQDCRTAVEEIDMPSDRKIAQSPQGCRAHACRTKTTPADFGSYRGIRRAPRLMASYIERAEGDRIAGYAAPAHEIAPSVKAVRLAVACETGGVVEVVSACASFAPPPNRQADDARFLEGVSAHLISSIGEKTAARSIELIVRAVQEFPHIDGFIADGQHRASRRFE